MSKNLISILITALILSTAATAEALNLGEAKSYVTRGLGPVLSTAGYKRRPHLEARTLEKRDQICSSDAYYYTYCTGTTFCAGAHTCINYIWLIVAGIVLLLLICGCMRRCRNNNAAADNNVVITTAVPVPPPGQTYQPEMAPAPAPYYPSPAAPSPYAQPTSSPYAHPAPPAPYTVQPAPVSYV
ncbi:hypothetical protein BGZ49_004634 [Haplosporangium sp. Z 27]|nr:hypothetical protein BGZ49_004634 [Haplosporangium sp. Z 27]